MKITRRSPFSGKVHSLEIDITEEQFNAWSNAGDDDPNRFLQVAFPHLSDDDREFIKTGVTAEEWDRFAFSDLPGGDTRPDSEAIDVESDAERRDHPTRYTEDDQDDWLGKDPS